MRIEKCVLGELPSVYAVCINMVDGQPLYMAATELYGRCLGYSAANATSTVVWDRPGGAMNLIPVGDDSGRVLAIQQAWPIYHFDSARIVDLVPNEDRRKPWHVTPILDLPFAHRITILEQGGTRWFVAATLAGIKDSQDDWSHPGKVVAGILPDRSGTPLQVQTILTGMHRNHGLHCTSLDGAPALLISGMDGLFSLTPPQERNGRWQTLQLLSHDVSDMVLHDLDGDGQAELITIEPFHGDQLVMYRRSPEQIWNEAARHSLAFGHVLWAGELGGQRGLLVGNRGADKDIYFLSPSETGSLDMNRTDIDSGTGPANVSVMHLPGHDVILCANHGVGQVVLYHIFHERTSH